MKIEPYSPTWEKPHTSFAEKFWPSKRRRSTPEYIYWKFRGNPGEDLTSFILATQKNEVIGQFGIIPCQVQIEDIIYEGQWACDLMVDYSLRGKGIAAQLYRKAHTLKPMTLGSDPSPAAEKSMLRNGYILLEGPRKFIFPFTINEGFKLKNKDIGFLNKIHNPFLLFLKLFKPGRFVTVSSDKYLKTRKIDMNKFISCFYDDDFAAWRFSSFKKYYPGMESYKMNDENYFCGFYNGTTFYLQDFNSSSLFNFFRLINFIRKSYPKLKRIRFYSNNQFLNKQLPFFGFIRFRTPTKVILYSDDSEIRNKLENKKFYYTGLDSDEMI